MVVEVGIEPTHNLSQWRGLELPSPSVTSPLKLGLLYHCAIPLYFGGKCRIRTHGAFQPFCFQDRHNRPLCQLSIGVYDRLRSGVKGATILCSTIELHIP